MRAELRSVLMFRIAPPVVAMWHQAVTKPAVIPPDDQMVPVMTRRLRTLSELCARGAQVRVSRSARPAIRRHCNAAGRRAIRRSSAAADSEQSLSLDYYQDGFHLNSKGSALFTAAVVQEMK